MRARLQHLHSPEDDGAVLILALLFILVVGLLGGALASFASGSLGQTSKEQVNRAQSYAAESAVQVAIQQVRSLNTINNAPGYTKSGNSTPNSCPATRNIPIPEGSVTGGTVSYDVLCGVGQAPLPFERSIVFVACPTGTTDANCLTDATSGASAFVPKPQYPAAIVVATSTFSDLQNGCHVTNFNDNCFAPGTSVDITNWNVASSNS